MGCVKGLTNWQLYPNTWEKGKNNKQINYL